MPARNKISHARPLLGFVIPACLIRFPETRGKSWTKEDVLLMEEDQDQRIFKKTRHTFVHGRWMGCTCEC